MAPAPLVPVAGTRSQSTPATIVARWLAQQKSSTTMRARSHRRRPSSRSSRGASSTCSARAWRAETSTSWRPRRGPTCTISCAICRARGRCRGSSPPKRRRSFSRSSSRCSICCAASSTANRCASARKHGASRRSSIGSDSIPPRHTRRAARKSSSASSTSCSSCRRRSSASGIGILALPLVGTLDSARTQVVMESLLERIVETESEVAIIDITGRPDRRHAGRAAPAEDDRRNAPDGRGLHHQRHPPADRPDDRPPRRRPRHRHRPRRRWPTRSRWH